MYGLTALETGSGFLNFLAGLYFVFVLYSVSSPTLLVLVAILGAWQWPKIFLHKKGLKQAEWRIGPVLVVLGSWLTWLGVSVFVTLRSTLSTVVYWEVWGAVALAEGIVLFVLFAVMVINELETRGLPVSRLKQGITV